MADAMVGTDLINIFADPFATVAVTFGAQSTRGFLDIEDVIENDDTGQPAQVRRTVLTARADSLTGPFVGLAIVADGANYRIRRPELSDDGEILRLILSPA